MCQLYTTDSCSVICSRLVTMKKSSFTNDSFSFFTLNRLVHALLDFVFGTVDKAAGFEFIYGGVRYIPTFL